MVALLFLHHVYLIQVTIALRFHLFPFRTEKLSSVTPMVLRNSGRVGSCRFLKPLYSGIGYRGFLFCCLNHTHHHHTTAPYHHHITYYLPHHHTSHHMHTHHTLPATHTHHTPPPITTTHHHITYYLPHHYTPPPTHHILPATPPHVPPYAYTSCATCHRIHTTIPTHTHTYRYLYIPTPHTTTRFATEKAHCAVVPLFFYAASFEGFISVQFVSMLLLLPAGCCYIVVCSFLVYEEQQV